ncbi:MAG: alanine--tRNA ligase [Alphaproteobacteria bacterium 43-37]|nr:MAG: alanine--tRNA ligase [Alphaproteobacteria bacterium 43-37]
MKTTAQIRSAFIDFFVKNGHTHVPSSPLVPHNDPTLLFTNAGMVQFKDVFTGLEKRSYTRAATSQKCLRAGGKHNDLENVGFTARHHTFFEMLGNFSFGDYFKEDAIHFAWECITKEYALPKDKLLVTVYSEDDDAAALWKKIAGLDEGRIIRIHTSDNFWSMGDTGPCGPCSEIFYDHGDKIPGGPPGSPDADGDRFIEIWNLVFMQFEQLANGERISLPKPSIDTGMGLERITTVMQGIHNNYETDLFMAIIETCQDILSLKATEANVASFRVIADHLRASSFLIADGVLPSNEGRGYVLRRIMRRAMRHAHILGAKQPLMHQLVGALIEQMGAACPELSRACSLISQTLKLEEERFRGMLERGLKLLQEETKSLSDRAPLPGSVAFKLYDTFGFPLDLTQDALKASNRSVDVSGFEEAMAKQRAESRAHWVGSGDAKTDVVWFDILEKCGATEFLGYELEQAEGLIVALLADGQAIEKACAGDKVHVVANQTPFYGESGGQMGDAGSIIVGESGQIKITDTLKKLGKIHVHVGEVLKGEVAVGQSAKFSVDAQRRSSLRNHHSATHLLHSALRRVLGDHVTQKGSLVAPDRLRFDFSHHQALTREEIRQIEKIVNAQIRANKSVTTRCLPPEQAIEMGAMALFGEKYGDEVRVVSMGQTDEQDQTFSLELCGGTHARQTGDIGALRIISEASVASGVRRIEAVAGEAVDNYVDEIQNNLFEAMAILKVSQSDMVPKIKVLFDDKRKLETEIKNLKQKMLNGSSSQPKDQETLDIFGHKVLFQQLEGVAPKDLRSVVDKLKNDLKSGIVVVANRMDEKIALMVGITSDLASRVNAVPLIQASSKILGGTGGGRPDFAQGGGNDLDKLEDSFKEIENGIREQLRA